MYRKPLGWTVTSLAIKCTPYLKTSQVSLPEESVLQEYRCFKIIYTNITVSPFFFWHYFLSCLFYLVFSLFLFSVSLHIWSIKLVWLLWIVKRIISLSFVDCDLKHYRKFKHSLESHWSRHWAGVVVFQQYSVTWGSTPYQGVLVWHCSSTTHMWSGALTNWQLQYRSESSRLPLHSFAYK